MIDRIEECLAHPERTYSPGEFRAMLKWLHKQMEASNFREVNKHIEFLETRIRELEGQTK